MNIKNLRKSILQYAVEGKLVQQDIQDESASILYDKIIKEKENLIKYLEDKIYSIQPKDCSINFFPEDGYDSEEDMLRANVDYNLLKAYQDILEKVKSGKYE